MDTSLLMQRGIFVGFGHVRVGTWGLSHHRSGTDDVRHPLSHRRFQIEGGRTPCHIIDRKTMRRDTPSHIVDFKSKAVEPLVTSSIEKR